MTEEEKVLPLEEAPSEIAEESLPEEPIAEELPAEEPVAEEVPAEESIAEEAGEARQEAPDPGESVSEKLVSEETASVQTAVPEKHFILKLKELRIPFPVKLLLGFLSFILVVALIGSVAVAAVIADLRQFLPLEIPGFEGFLEMPIAPELLGEMSLSQILAKLQAFATEKALRSAKNSCLVTMILLVLCNFNNVPKGLRWCAFPCLLIGGILSIPTYMVLNSPDLISSIFADVPMVADAVTEIIERLSTVHYGLLGAGAKIFVLSLGAWIVYAIIRAIIRGWEEALEFAM